jgi:hypothetical protein
MFQKWMSNVAFLIKVIKGSNNVDGCEMSAFFTNKEWNDLGETLKCLGIWNFLVIFLALWVKKLQGLPRGHYCIINTYTINCKVLSNEAWIALYNRYNFAK